MAAADYRLLTEATGQRIAAGVEALSGTGAAAAAARTNLDVYSKGETDTAIAQSTATTYEQLSASSLGINGEGSIKTFKYGRIVILVFNIAFFTDLPYGQAAFTLPDNLKPYVGFTFNLTTQSNTYSGGYFEIATNGDVICYSSPSTNIYLGGCITYLAA